DARCARRPLLARAECRSGQAGRTALQTFGEPALSIAHHRRANSQSTVCHYSPSHSAFACELRWGSIVSNRRPRTSLKQELMRLPRLERASQRIYLYSDSHRMGLAAAALDRGWRLVLRDQARRKIEQPPRKHARALGELLRVLHYRDVVLHVLVRPAARMSDKRELRKDEA